MMLTLSWRAAPVLGAVLLLGAGCVHYDIRQSSLVPIPTLPATPSRTGPVDVLLSSHTLTAMTAPTRASSTSDAALWVPREQIEGAFSARMLGRRASIRLDWMHGLSSGARAIVPNELPRPASAVWGVGPGISFHGGDDFGWQADVSADVLLVSVPSWVEATASCSWPCSATPSAPEVTEQTDSVLLYSVSTVVGYRVDDALRVFATLAVRNHPSNRAAFVSNDPDAEVYSGPVNLLAGLGVEIGVASWLSLIPQVELPVTESPVRYAPVLSLGVRATVPDATTGG